MCLVVGLGAKYRRFSKNFSSGAEISLKMDSQMDLSRYDYNHNGEVRK